MRDQKSLPDLTHVSFETKIFGRSNGGQEVGKIKRAIIEITECEVAAVVIDSGALPDIAKIAADGVVIWVDGVSAVVRDRFDG